MWPFSTVDVAAVQAKLAKRDEALSTALAFSSAEHQPILNATATEIVRRIEKGDWTASQVLEAYIARAAQAQEMTKCITEVLFERARDEARELDEHFATTKSLRGPLHGVPVSLKDQFNIAGQDSSIGYTTWINKPADEDATIAKVLRDAGAIPFVKGNIPQTLLSFECRNPLWGQALNPWSPHHTPGGSSGGDAALVAMDGAAFGIGTDIGGSLRIPAHYCGIYSLKPGFARTSPEGIAGPCPGFEAIRTTSGPMCRSVDDVEAAARVIFGQHRGSSTYLPAPVPFRDVELPKKIRFGYYTSDYFVKASPACKRAVSETVEALRLQGHECVEFKVPGAIRALELFTGLTSADGYQTLLSHLGPDSKDSSMFIVTLGPKLPGFLRALASWLVGFYDPIFANLLACSRHKSVQEFLHFIAEKKEFEHSWRNEVWDGQGFDAIIAPVQALPAIPHHGADLLAPLAAGTALYNIVDTPVGIVPVTRVDPEKDALTDEWFTGPDRGSKIIEDRLYGKGAVYDPVNMQGLPVGVQVVGKPWEDEQVVGFMRVVDEALGQRGLGPGSWKPKA